VALLTLLRSHPVLRPLVIGLAAVAASVIALLLPLKHTWITKFGSATTLRFVIGVGATVLFAEFGIFVARCCVEGWPDRLGLGPFAAEWNKEEERITEALRKQQDLIAEFRDFTLETARRLEELEARAELAELPPAIGEASEGSVTKMEEA